MGKIIRAALYRRVSTEEQAMHGFSLAAQLEALQEYAANHSMEIVGDYCDEGISARKPMRSRPAMGRLLRDVEAGKVDLILFTKLDRWFRNVRDYHTVQGLLDQHGVSWQAILEDYSTTTADGRLKVNIMLSVAENEADRTSERIRFIFENRRKKGEIAGGFSKAAFGYRPIRDPDGKRTLEKDPETKEACAEFWRLALAYNSTRKAGAEVSARWPEFAKPYHFWLHIASSPTYAGIYRDREDMWEPYISPEEWRAYQSHRNIRQQPSGRVYILSGLLRCPVCGSRLSATYKDLTPSGGKLYVSYRCRNAGKNGPCSYRSYVSEQVVEAWLRDNILAEVDRYGARIAAERAAVIQFPQADPAKLEEKLRRLGVVYTAGGMGDDEYLAAAADLRRQIQEAKKQESAPLPDLSKLRAALNSGTLAIYAELTREERQRFWRSIISEIHIQGHQPSEVIFAV